MSVAPVYVGFDCSTQSLSVVVIDADRRAVVFRDTIVFATPFESRDGGIVHASPQMWRDALLAMLARVADAVDASRIRAISGSAQQHGSVYCGVDPDTLTRPSVPIWMDTSTTRECQEIEAALGGPQATARLTGSRCYPRFTGPQIRKFATRSPDAYERTSRIHLVSSYLTSVLIGRHAPIDHADGSGMNLMNIETRAWDARAVDATAPGLLARLPALVPSTHVAGVLSRTWQEAYGLPEARVVVWSGDNPCSLVGTGLIREGQLAVSLGTSDTIFGPMDAPRVSEDGTGHVFASPLGAYMGITVFRNGSLAREHVRERFGMSWDAFSEALRRTPAGNGGAMLLPWFEPEITPRVDRPAPREFGLDGAAPDRHVRAVVEAQALALRRHSEWMQVQPEVIHATGGAAANREILQVVADVFEVPVHHFPSTDAAALGAAVRAFQADTGVPWDRAIEGFTIPLASAVLPIPAHVDALARARRIHAQREAHVLREFL